MKLLMPGTVVNSDKITTTGLQQDSLEGEIHCYSEQVRRVPDTEKSMSHQLCQLCAVKFQHVVRKIMSFSVAGPIISGQMSLLKST